MFVFVWGSQIVDAYSTIGRTSDMYPFSFTGGGQERMFLRRKAQVLLAFLVVWSMCVFQFSLGVIVSPRYFPAVEILSGWLWIE